MAMLSVLLCFFWVALASATTLLRCPYDVAQNAEGEWVRTLSLYRRLTELQTELGTTRPWGWRSGYAEFEIAGNQAQTYVNMAALSSGLQADILDPSVCNCAIMDEEDTVAPARAPKIVDGELVFDDTDTTQPIIQPTRWGVPPKERASLPQHRWFAWHWWLSPRDAVAQIVNAVLDTFNRANENPLTGLTGQWPGKINSALDPNRPQLLTNAVTASGAGLSTTYWGAATFTNPEVYLTHIGGANANRSELHIVYLAPNTPTPSGYRLQVIKQDPGADVWNLHRIDAGTAVVIGTTQTQEIPSAGSTIRFSHVGGVLIAQNCPTTCTTIRSVTETTYGGPANLGFGVNSSNVTIDDVGGGSQGSGSRRRIITW